MVYFKDAAITPSEIDPKQLAAVQEFKGSMSGKGGMYSPFKDRSGFESSVRAHLSAVALSFAAKKRTLKHPFDYIESEQTNSELIVAEEEYDDSDYFVIHNDRMMRMTNSNKLIVNAIASYNEEMLETAAEIDNLNENGSSLHDVCINFATHTNILAQTLSTQVPVSSKSRKIGFNSLSKALSLIVNEGDREKNIFGIKNSLLVFYKTMTEAGNSIYEMKASIEKWPQVQNDLTAAQQALIFQCESFIAEIDSASININNIVRSINKMYHD